MMIASRMRRCKVSSTQDTQSSRRRIADGRLCHNAILRCDLSPTLCFTLNLFDTFDTWGKERRMAQTQWYPKAPKVFANGATKRSHECHAMPQYGENI